MTARNWLEVVLYLVILIAISPLIVFVLAKMSFFFTFLESGNIKYIYRGDTLVKIIADVRGKKVDGHKLVDGEEHRTQFQKRFGIYWVGIWPFTSVKKFMVSRRKELEVTANLAPTAWIKDLEPKEVDSLRALFPRPFLLDKVELGDRQTVTLLVVAKFRVVDAYIPVVELKGAFFELTGSTLRGAIIDILERLTMDEFIAANKGEGGILEILTQAPTDPSDPNHDPQKGLFNQALEKRVGLHLTGATVPDWNVSDEDIRKAMDQRFVAQKLAEATVVTAEAYQRKVGLETEADAERVVALGKARGTQIRETVAAMAGTLGNHDEVARGVATILQMEAATSPNSKLTTLVTNGGATAVVPVGGDKR